MGRVVPIGFIDVVNNLPKLQNLWDVLIGHNVGVFGR
jgi:hypothetical protein